MSGESLADVKLTYVDTLDDLLDLKDWLGRSRDWLGFDLETSGLNLGRDRVRLAQLGDRNHGWAIPCEGPNSFYGAFKELIEAYDSSPIVAHNLIFDSSFLKRDGIIVPQHLAHDSMVMAQLVTSHLPVGLKPVASRLIDQKSVAGQQVLNDAMKQQGWGWETVPLDFPPYWMYGALDPVLTCRITERLWQKVHDRYRQPYEIELGAIHVLRDAQLTGMTIDVDYARRTSAELEAEIASLSAQLPCNPNAPKQVVAFLESQGATLTKRTEKGHLAADDEVLAYWEEKIPECKPMRRYRECTKLKSSYFDNLLGLEVDGIVHPSIRVLGAQKTGRMSITEPALQTLPKSSIGRNAFIAGEGETLISADFSGIELRLLAHMADEQNMIERFCAGEDLHAWTAEQIFHVTPVEKSQRNVAKTSGYAKIYGAGVTKFAYSAKLPEAEAAEFLNKYDELFPAVASFQERISQEVHESRPDDKGWGEVFTEYGRRLFVPKDEAYKGVNYKDQGTAGEVLKVKLCELSNAGLGPYITLPVHDEVVFRVPDDILDEVVHTVEEVMPEDQKFKVPLTVDLETTKRWGDLYA